MYPLLWFYPQSHSQSQFQRPTKQLVDSTGNSHHSPSWHQVPQQAIPHQQYPSSPQVLAPLQSHDPSTGSELNPVIDHKNLHRLAQGVPTGHIPGATPVKVHTFVSSHSFREELHKLYKQFPDLLESQDKGPAASTSDPTYQNTGDVLQLEGETGKPQESLLPDTFKFPEPVTTTVTRQNVRVVADYDDNSLSEPQLPESSRPIPQHQGISPKADGNLKPIPKPRNKLQDMRKTFKSFDNEADEKPKSPQPKPRTRGRMRNVKSASDLQQLGGNHILVLPSAQLEISDEDGDNMSAGEVQPTTCDAQTGQHNGVEQSVKSVPTPCQPLRDDNATNDREGVNMLQPVATGTVTGEESGEREKDGQEYPIRHKPPISPLQGKTSATVLESNARARTPDQVPVKDQVNKEVESSLDFGGQRAQNKSHQETSSSSRTKGMPSPQDLVVGETDLTDPAVEGFWYCSYCTNLVNNTLHVCDICGTDQDTV